MKKEDRKSRVIRPIATVGFTYMITLLAVCHLPLMISAFLFLFCLTISFLIAIIKPIRNQRGLLILLTTGIACGAHFVYTYFNYNPALKLDGKSVSILATVEDVSTSQSGKSVLTVSLDRSVVSTPVPVKAKLYLDEPGDFRPADWIRGVAFFYLPSQEYGISSPTQSAKADGIYLYASAKTMELSVARPNLFQLSSWLYDLRLALKEKANALFQGESAAVFQGMLLGNNDEVSNKTYRDFVHTGILHVMVVSGLHLVIVSQFVIRTLKAFRIKRKLRYLIGMAVIPFFMAVTGFTPSVNRAGIMLMLFYAAHLFNREPDSLTSIGLIGLVFSSFSPYIVTDLGFQLSYLSTIGIILFSKKMADRIKQRLNIKHAFPVWVVETFCVTPAAMLLTLPISALRFQAFPLLSPIFNLILSPLFTVVLTLGVPLLLFSFIPFLSVIAEVMALVCSALITLIRVIASFCTQIPHSYTPLGYRFVYFFLIGSILLMFLILLKMKSRFRGLIAALICIFGFLIPAAGHYLDNHRTLNLITCTQGKESATVLGYRDQMIVLNYNELALRLAETTHLKKIPFVSAEEDLALLAEYTNYYTVDTVCTETVVPNGVLNCREIFSPIDADISFTNPIRMTVKVNGKKTYYRFSYRNTNIIYGNYDETFCSLYEQNKENIYILTNDCNSVFQKPIKCVILLKGITEELRKSNPDINLIDGTKQGFTPIKIRANGDITVRSAGQWPF